MDLNTVSMFIKVVEQGSLTAAAKYLNMPKSTLSRRLGELEDALGVRLLERTTRRLNLTDAGRIYYQRTNPLIQQLACTEAAISHYQDEPQGHLKIHTPIEFGTALLAPVIAQFQRLYPKITMQVLLSAEWPDLISQGIDVSFRVGEQKDSANIARLIGAPKRVLVASPDYIRQYGEPKTPDDLLDHACLTFDIPNGDVWTFFNEDGSPYSTTVDPRLRANNAVFLREQAAAGLGLALLPHFICHEALQKGELVKVMCSTKPTNPPIYAVYPSRRNLSAKTIKFLDYVTQKMTNLFE